jgi:type II secretory pathway pseudopilin PulG
VGAGHRRDRLVGGFTWIELLGVLAVTAVLGAVGTSAYRTYGVRAQIADAVLASAGYQRSVERAFRSTGLVPETAAALPLAAANGSEFVDVVDVIDGRVDLQFGRFADAAIAGRRLSLTPFETASQNIVWICGNRVPGPGLKPLGFAGGGHQSVQVVTTIEPRYLPSPCR